MVEELQVPIHLKMTLTIKEAAAYSNIESAQLPVRFVRRDEKAGKTPGVRTVHQPYNGNLKVSSLLRKESPCATIIKYIGASSHSGKGASEWVKVYEAKNAARVSARERTDYIAQDL